MKRVIVFSSCHCCKLFKMHLKKNIQTRELIIGLSQKVLTNNIYITS